MSQCIPIHVERAKAYHKWCIREAGWLPWVVVVQRLSKEHCSLNYDNLDLVQYLTLLVTGYMPNVQHNYKTKHLLFDYIPVFN